MPTSLLGGLNQEATQQELLAQATLLLASILEKMPRVDVNDRMIINGSEIASSVTVSSGTVTTVSAISNAGTTSKPLDGLPLHMSNAGCMHIYNNIIVS